MGTRSLKPPWFANRRCELGAQLGREFNSLNELREGEAGRCVSMVPATIINARDDIGDQGDHRTAQQMWLRTEQVCAAPTPGTRPSRS